MELLGPASRPVRTSKAIAALGAQGLDILARTRQIIILCDGRHTFSDLCFIMGEEIIRARLPGLLQEGLVTLGTGALPDRDAADDYLSNRMLGNTRRYLLDRLDLLPQASAVIYRRRLAVQREPAAIFSLMLDTLRWMTGVLPVSYMARIHAHLEEIMPEAYIARYLNVRVQLLGGRADDMPGDARDRRTGPAFQPPSGLGCAAS